MAPLDHPPLWLHSPPAIIRPALERPKTAVEILRESVQRPAPLLLGLTGAPLLLGGGVSPAYITASNGTNVTATTTYSNMVPARTFQQRFVVVLVMGDPTARTVDSVTIAGVTATQRPPNGSIGGADVYILDALVDAGAAANVVVDLSGANGIDELLVALYTVGGKAYRTGDTDTGTNTAAVPGIAVFAGEYAIGGVHTYDAFPGAGNHTWTNLTENNDVDWGDGAGSTAATAIAADGTLSVTAANANGDEICAAVAVYA